MSADSSPQNKRQKTSDKYELIYWPNLPGRGEHVRLAFEATSTPYEDISNGKGPNSGVKSVLEQISSKNLGTSGNPPPLAPPILRHGDVIISQTSNILLYLGPQLGLIGETDDKSALYSVNQLVLTALDGFSNEAHDTHHPVATGAYYEDQKDEAKKRAKDYTTNRLPKYLGYFERVLHGQENNGFKSNWLYGNELTCADLVLFQCLDGLLFAFPNAMHRMKTGNEYGRVWTLYDKVKNLPAITTYLASDRRMKYGNGIYRHYPELDEEHE